MSTIKNLVGQKFNRLTVIEFYERKNKTTFWKCRCDCGKEKIIRHGELRESGTKSCGCYQRPTGNLYNNGLTHIELSKKFNIGLSTVHYIITHKTWKHLKD